MAHVQCGLRLPEELIAKLKQKAIEDNRSLNNYLVILLQKEIERLEERA